MDFINNCRSNGKLGDMKAFKSLFLILAACTVLAGLVSCEGSSSDSAETVSGPPVNSPAPNTAPVANAGPDQSVATGAAVTLDGSGSTDADGDVLTYSWSFISIPAGPAGSVAILSNATAVNPTFTADTEGSYVLALIVNDGTADSAPDTVTITAVTPVIPIIPMALPDTGMAFCYDATGALINCTGTGQDGEYSANPVSFTDNGDGTVSDNVTSLMWQKCSFGLENATCGGTASTYNWYQASGTADGTYNPGGIDACGSLDLAGYSDWRLPDEMELMGIVDYGTYGPAIDTAYFPGTESFLWSSTSDAANPSVAWGVNMVGYGYVTYSSKTTDYYFVRCVRGGNPAQPMSFTDNGNGTITDEVTALMWQKCSAGQNNDEVCGGAASVNSWQPALDYCNGLSLAGFSDWRLPDIKELRSIVDDSLSNPAINLAYFPNTAASYYWSSTTSKNQTSGAWFVHFQGGEANYNGKAFGYRARCVR